MKKENYYTSLEYKNMDQLKLLQVYSNLINTLVNAYSGNGRFKDDIEQELKIELLKLQETYDINRNSNFTGYIQKYLLARAQKSYQQNASVIYVPYSTSYMLNNTNRDNPMFTYRIDDYSEDQPENYKLFTYDKCVIKENSMFTIIKIILKELKKSNYSDNKKQKIKDYLREYVETGKLRKIFNRILKNLCKDTVLKNKFIFEYDK